MIKLIPKIFIFVVLFIIIAVSGCITEEHVREIAQDEYYKHSPPLQVNVLTTITDVEIEPLSFVCVGYPNDDYRIDIPFYYRSWSELELSFTDKLDGNTWEINTVRYPDINIWLERDPVNDTYIWDLMDLWQENRDDCLILSGTGDIKYNVIRFVENKTVTNYVHKRYYNTDTWELDRCFDNYDIPCVDRWASTLIDDDLWKELARREKEGW